MFAANNFSEVDFQLINSKLKDKKLRIDVGTSVNTPVSKYWLDHLTDIFVIAVEPNPNALDGNNFINYTEHKGINYSIRRVMEKHPQTDCYYYINGACDNVDTLTVKDFYVLDGDPGCSSLLRPMNIGGCNIQEVAKVTCFSLKMLLDKIDVEYVEVLKIDSQGKDLDIVKGLGDAIKRVAYLDVENDCTSQYQGACRYQDLDGYILGRGFNRYEVGGGNSRYRNSAVSGFNNFSGCM